MFSANPYKNKTWIKFKQPFKNPFKNAFSNTFGFTRTSKSTDTCVGCREQGYRRKDNSTTKQTLRKFNSTAKQTELESKVSCNSFDFNIKVIHGFQDLQIWEFKFTNLEKYIPVKGKLKQNQGFWKSMIMAMKISMKSMKMTQFWTLSIL